MNKHKDCRKAKLCTRCGKEKLLSEFHKRTASKDGLNYSCKECIAQQNKNQRLKDPEKMRAYKKDWRKNQSQEYKDKCAENHKRWRDKNKKKRCENSKKWRDENPDYLKNYYKKRKESIALQAVSG